MKFLIAYDGSEQSKKAVRFLLRILKKEDEVYVITVIKEAPRSPDQKIIEDEKKAEGLHKEVLELFPSAKSAIIESGDVVSTIIDYCERVNCDMIVTGSRGLTGIKKVVIGSVSSALIEKAKVPILVVK
ncbi:universal stress protein [Sulfolobus acidocaldarius]|uniref:Conserved Prokaryal protein n=4 Tax=Sulfolobus acidocaldarius TaxID=2285 RepID=Q4JAC8_SULAC|nr:universal stress protein [Sulfolobus acidocaldarius]AAY80252.1 conserved Prokaryal protein [Sulfolobus acidocaldarius DSM 639]AGE70832.1 hypothetical protein SacN8_04305 [Sulfolobus acidocaldarius N8]AGE73103.1 hypothetical protein SacRon12I_04295 [Sulfolobus acidocaldarius Ron12/I]ALU28853.1 universal stress protein UspA [Sulfolobus acidocaldarius]ALU31574.1 universal stress protein UspA [Sulfolobus acidocaldarius]